MVRLFTALVMIAAATAVPGFADDKKKDPSQIGNRKVAGGPNFYSVEREIALGKQLAIEVQRQARMVDDAIISEYVNRLCQSLVRNSDVTFPVSIQVIDDDALNAFTLPGGFVFVNTGLIRLSESEAELAAALSHELGHVAARHATRQATQGTILNIATIPLGVVGGWAGVAARQAAGIGVPLGFFKFSRAYESEADMLGVQYLYAAGYDPNASIDIFERIEATERQKPGTMSRLFGTHPMTGDRIQQTQKNIAALLPGKPEYVVNTSEFEQMRQRLIDLQSRRKSDAADPNRPRLRRSPGGTVEPGAAESDKDKDDRPTLHRRDD